MVNKLVWVAKMKAHELGEGVMYRIWGRNRCSYLDKAFLNEGENGGSLFVHQPRGSARCGKTASRTNKAA